MDAWKAKYGTHMLIAQAYCKVFDKSKSHPDTIEIRLGLQELSEEAVLDLPPFFQQLAVEMDNELQRIEQIQAPDDEEK
jgi:hypothetical protein